MTTEEKRTVELLRQNGKSNAEIAEHLHISPNTIKSYLKHKKRSDNSCLMCGITITQTPHRKKKILLRPLSTEILEKECRKNLRNERSRLCRMWKEILCL